MMILVTGATGHIGNVLVRQLVARGDDVRILVQADLPDYLRDLNVEVMRGDLRDPYVVAEAVRGAETVMHLGGIVSISSFRDKMLEDVNVGGTQNVIDACQAFGVQRLMYTSSVHALPDYKDGRIIREEEDFHSTELFGAYAQTKATATQLVVDAHRSGLDAVMVFPSGVLGPFDFKGSEAGRLIREYANNEQPFYIDGEYNFVDVRDVAAGMIAAVERGRAGEGYILAGEKMSLSEFFADLHATLPAMRKPRVKIPQRVALGAAWITESACLPFKIKPPFTAYAVRVLQSNCNITSEKAATELGYSYRPITETIRDAVHWLVDTGRLDGELSSSERDVVAERSGV
jgi:dihydroflavonol-4-reductase